MALVGEFAWIGEYKNTLLTMGYPPKPDDD
jgi:hypothetical protein